MLFDTHAHLDDEQFDTDREELIEGLFKNGVGNVLTVGCDMKSSLAAIKLAEKYDFIYAAVGVHPHECEHMTESDIDALRTLSAHPKVCAIGEIGLDYYYDTDIKEIQKKWFARQMDLACETGKPVIIHNRDAHEDTLKVLKKYASGKLSGVVHCYSGSVEMSREIFKMGLYISVGGTVTFKNANRVREVVKNAPIDRILLETDCPYLSPEPHRGSRNNPANTKYVAEKIAEIKEMTAEEVISITERNGKTLFSIK